MGTAIRVELWSDERAAGEAAIDAVMDEMHRIDRAMSPHKADSELSRINRDAGAGAGADQRRDGAPDRPRGRVLASSRTAPSTSPTPRVGHLYDYRQRIRPERRPRWRGRAPRSAGTICMLDAQARTVRFARAGHAHRPGRLRQGPRGRQRGGDPAPARHRATRSSAPAATAACIGDRRGRPWTIGVRDPRRPGEVVAVLPLEDVSISTSGDYERYFDADGVRFHHLIDPATGRSPRGVHSVTILADDGLTSEALSKSVFVLGVDARHGVWSSRSRASTRSSSMPPARFTFRPDCWQRHAVRPARRRTQ